jgi:hypothetical protein
MEEAPFVGGPGLFWGHFDISPYRTPEKVDNFQKSNLGVRILLFRFLDFRKTRRTNHSDAFAFASYFGVNRSIYNERRRP